MKNLLIVAFFLLQTFDKPGITVDDDYTFQVCELQGKSKDLKKLFFLHDDKNKIDISKLTMFYEPVLRLLAFRLSGEMIGYYHVSSKGEIIIDNFNPLRSMVSFRDLRERKYVLGITLKLP